MHAGRPHLVGAVVACLVAWGTGQAAVTYVNPDDIAIPTGFGGVYLDLNSGTTTLSTEEGTALDDSYTISHTQPAAGLWDINFFFGGGALVHSDTINLYRAGDGTDNFSAVHNVGLGSVIDGSPAGASRPLNTAGFGASGAFPAATYMGGGGLEFSGGSNGYIAFVLDDPGGTLYGWMQVDLRDDGTAGAIKEWAYSDMPIQVGQVPEPSVATLAVLALSTVLLRRRI